MQTQRTVAGSSGTGSAGGNCINEIGKVKAKRRPPTSAPVREANGCDKKEQMQAEMQTAGPSANANRPPLGTATALRSERQPPSTRNGNRPPPGTATALRSERQPPSTRTGNRPPIGNANCRAGTNGK
ncbi:hypothetical protein [Methanimicrococcus hacksteinii]|uniref:hypothetical protein n=1 Tax=Methanimicrococcus hacksteinii TaxID=3028293 RepID=UPI00298F30C2|nr:hypothetical protein [Methanimicrococcus sp. At1]